MKRLRIIFFLVCLPLGLLAEIVELERFSDLAPHIDKNTLVILDLDNTVMAHPHDEHHSLGSDQWFSAALREHTDAGKNLDNARDIVLEDYFAIQHIVSVQAVEKTTPQFIRTWQNHHVPIIGLTSRSDPLLERTVAQLNSIGVDLSRTSPLAHVPFLETEHPAHYHQGIIFAGNNEKGKALCAFFDEAKLHPSKVIFVDDKPRHINSVDTALSLRKIPCIAFRYGAQDPIVARYDHSLAQEAWRSLQEDLAMP